MNIFTILIVSILPIILVLLYVYKKDSDKEPKKLLIDLFLYGILICIPVAFIEIFVEVVADRNQI